jgi:hypothetical protein
VVLSFYILLNIAAILFFIKYKKRMLHTLENFIYWLIATIIFQNYTAILYSNTNHLIIPNKFSLALSHFFNRTFLIPIIIVTFLNIYLMATTIWRKLLSMIGFIIVLVGYEMLSDLLGVLQHFHWRLWWSISYWFAALVLSIGFMKFFRKILYGRGTYS